MTTNSPGPHPGNTVASKADLIDHAIELLEADSNLDLEAAARATVNEYYPRDEDKYEMWLTWKERIEQLGPIHYSDRVSGLMSEYDGQELTSYQWFEVLARTLAFLVVLWDLEHNPIVKGRAARAAAAN
jgi:hypothetical protein